MGFFFQCTEVGSPNAMELESLKHQIAFLEGKNILINKLVTDRHSQVTSYLPEEKHGKPQLS